MSRSLSRPLSFLRTRGSWPIAFLVIAALVLGAPQVFAAKGGNSNNPGGSGGGGKIPGPTTTLVGVVTNADTSAPIAGANVTVQAVTSFNTVTDATGNYSVKVPSDAYYNVTVAAADYEDFTWSGTIFKGKTYTLDAQLDPVYVPPVPDNVTLTPSIEGSTAPGESPTAVGGYTLEGSCKYNSSSWAQAIDEEGNLEGVPVLIGDADSDSTPITLGSASEYAAHLIQVLKSPPIKESDLPPDVTLQPINEIEKGLQDRNQVVAINPFAHEKAADAVLTYSVDTSCGLYSTDVTLAVELPWVVNTGVRTVPVNVPVLLLAKCGDELNESTGEYECQDQTAFSWEITSTPGGSGATLTDANSRSPWFTPDLAGTYQLTETTSGATLDVHAGRYHGVIDPYLTYYYSPDGRPVADENCTGCHKEGGAAPDNFTAWRETGHAEAFTQGITTNSHFGENCFACHAVGFNRDNAGGIDNTPNYDYFLETLLAAQHDTPPTIAGLWDTMLLDMPDTARLSNIQCESCHGPQDYTQAHKDQPGAPRVSLASDVCGSCHGEPARHGRFQQWQLSNHADYDLARSRGTNGNCARCHSGNGFVAWSEIDFDPATPVDVTWNADTVVPQTCAACHNPHDTGTTSGSDGTDAKVRVMGDTYELTAGFEAIGVGKGATCMTCHNSRADVPRNDATWASLSDSQKTGSPHHGVQADLIMGQNLYFTGNVPTPGKHKLIEDVCVTCHMNATQPPDILSYNQAGTNHTFAADPGLCVECHGDAAATLADQVDAEITGYLGTLQTKLGVAWKRLIEANYPLSAGACAANGTTTFVDNVEWVYSRGTRLNITVGGTTCTSVNPSSATGNGTSLQALALAAKDGALYKAAWNYGLNYEDETINGCVDSDDTACDPPHTRRGVHNHAFSQQGLLGAISAVQAVP